MSLTETSRSSSADDDVARTAAENMEVKESVSNPSLIASINGKFLLNPWTPLSTSCPSSRFRSKSAAPHKRRESPFRPTRHSSINRARAEKLYSSGSWKSDNFDKESVSSVEEETTNLGKKVEKLKEHLENLMEKQGAMDIRYKRVRQDNSNLIAKIHILEEQVNEVRIRGEERLEEEKKRNKDEVKRLKMEMLMEIENYAIRSQGMQSLKDSLNQEVFDLKCQLENARKNNIRIKKDLSETQTVLMNEQKDLLLLKEERMMINVNDDLGDEVTVKESKLIRKNDLSQNDSGLQLQGCDEVFVDHPHNARIAELEDEVDALKSKNKIISENYEELQAELISIELSEGKCLVKMSSQGLSNSLAEEFEAMTGAELRRKVEEQRNLINQLQNYIDSVLLRIMEREPGLLEVRRNK